MVFLVSVIQSCLNNNLIIHPTIHLLVIQSINIEGFLYIRHCFRFFIYIVENKTEVSLCSIRKVINY